MTTTTTHPAIWRHRRYHDDVSFTTHTYRKSFEIHHRPIRVIVRTNDTIHISSTTPTIRWWARTEIQCRRIVRTHDPNPNTRRPVQRVHWKRTRQCVAVKPINDSMLMINSLLTKPHHARTRIEAIIIESCNEIFLHINSFSLLLLSP